MDIKSMFKFAMENGASDLHLCVGLPPIVRINQHLHRLSDVNCNEESILSAINEILPSGKKIDYPIKDTDLAIDIPGVARLRTNVYYDNNGICIAFRVIPNQIMPLEQLGLPEKAKEVCYLRRGLVLVTGVTGSGKSTTLASVIDRINLEQSKHIITIEDPIEYLHTHKKSIVNQREIGLNIPSFAHALTSALREDPDIILVGEMRDIDTIRIAITAAETGHLVFATLHTKNAAQSVNRIIDVFPPNQQEQIRTQLAETLDMVISQALVPSGDKKRMLLASELMVCNTAVKNLIREKRTHQIKSVIESGLSEGMCTFEQSLKKLLDAGSITQETAYQYAFDRSIFKVSS